MLSTQPRRLGPSLSLLQSFIKKVTRMIYFDTCHVDNSLTKPSRGSKRQPMVEIEPEVSIMHKIDPVARIIPLVIDYLLEFEIAEEKSIAELLQLDEKFVR